MKKFFNQYNEYCEVKDHVGLKALALTGCVYNNIKVEPSLKEYVGEFLPKARSRAITSAGDAGSIKINR